MSRKKGDTITADYVNDLLRENAYLQGFRQVVFNVIEGFTLPPDVRKILETAYYKLPRDTK